MNCEQGLSNLNTPDSTAQASHSFEGTKTMCSQQISRWSGPATFLMACLALGTISALAGGIPEECLQIQGQRGEGPFCTTQPFVDCDNDGTCDADEILCCEGDPACGDCNDNGIPDGCDITDGTSLDCDGNGVPDECLSCPPLDIVFVMDTSGSMNDEAAALCNSIVQVVADLGALGIIVNPSFLGITQTPGGDFSCLTDNVANLLGTAVPGTVDTLNDSEDWGPATAVVADGFPWTPGAVRLIVPISDEGAQDGNACNDPGDDRDSITNAIAIANANGVVVSPITGTGASQCVIDLATDLAAGTGGTTFASTDPNADLPSAINSIVLAACESFSDCNENGIPDACDPDCNENGTPDDCELDSETDSNGDGLLDACDPCFNPGDTTPPVITGCPENISGSLDAECSFPAPDLQVDVTDNCTATEDLVITTDPADLSNFGLGENTVTVTVTDAAGNSASCTVTITLDIGDCDDSPPPQPAPCDPSTGGVNILLTLLFHAPVCGIGCPLMILMTLCGMLSLRSRIRRTRQRRD